MNLNCIFKCLYTWMHYDSWLVNSMIWYKFKLDGVKIMTGNKLKLSKLHKKRIKFTIPVT